MGPGDRIGQYTNQTLIMRSCNDDGLLLKPSKPITAIDEQIYAKAFGGLYGPTGEVWTTHSKINNFTFGILLAADVKNTNYQITPKNIGVNVSVRLTKLILNVNNNNKKLINLFDYSE